MASIPYAMLTTTNDLYEGKTRCFSKPRRATVRDQFNILLCEVNSKNVIIRNFLSKVRSCDASSSMTTGSPFFRKTRTEIEGNEGENGQASQFRVEVIRGTNERSHFRETNAASQKSTRKSALGLFSILSPLLWFSFVVSIVLHAKFFVASKVFRVAGGIWRWTKTFLQVSVLFALYPLLVVVRAALDIIDTSQRAIFRIFS